MRRRPLHHGYATWQRSSTRCDRAFDRSLVRHSNVFGENRTSTLTAFSSPVRSIERAIRRLPISRATCGTNWRPRLTLQLIRIIDPPNGRVGRLSSSAIRRRPVRITTIADSRHTRNAAYIA